MYPFRDWLGRFLFTQPTVLAIQCASLAFASCNELHGQSSISSILAFLHLLISGNFAAQNASNRLNVAVWQYRSGVFLRQLLLGISNNAQGQAMSCHRVIMSQGGYGEDFEPTTDHYEVMFENANASTNDFDLTLFQGQIYWYPAL